MTNENQFEDGLPDEVDEPVIGDAPPRAHTLFSNKVYDQLKFLAQIVLPAVATFYGVVGGIWGLPAVEETVGTIVAVDLLLGALLQISTNQYHNSDGRFDGTLYVKRGSNELGEPVLRSAHQVDTPAEVVEGRKEILLKVEEAPDEFLR